MVRVLTKAALSEPRKKLVELMQEINFGCIYRLEVLHGEPVINPLPRVEYEVKFGGDNSPRPERDTDNFLLKTQVVELFQHFDRLGNGTIEVLEIKHGLPFRMMVAGTAA
jgi:hypothetical protein